MDFKKESLTIEDESVLKSLVTALCRYASIFTISAKSSKTGKTVFHKCLALSPPAQESKNCNYFLAKNAHMSPVTVVLYEPSVSSKKAMTRASVANYLIKLEMPYGSESHILES